MSLRRTALQRRTELRRTPLHRKTPMPRAGRELKKRVAKAQRNTGPSKATRAVVLCRSAGFCERCGKMLNSQRDGWVRPHAYHHRQPRQAGGSTRAGINSPANLLLLCDRWPNACHPWVESNRELAYAAGLLVHSWEDPETVPVELVDGDGSFYLTADGDRIEVAA